MEEKRKIITDILGSYRRIGNEHLFHCPYCEHHKKKLSVNFALGAFKCWVCDTRGKNIYRIVRKFGNYQQRQKFLELQGRLDLSEFENLFQELNDEEILQTVELPKEFISLANKHLPISSQRPLKYLESRGISKRDIQLWKIGYCPKGKYGGRIVIPSFNINGDINYFISRTYVGHQRKYLNPSASKNFIFNELYIDWDDPVILVEGAFDAIVAGTNAIPILGSTLRPESKLFQALAINDTPVYMALDQDAEKKAGHMIKNMLQYDMEVFKIDTSAIEDVGSMNREQFDIIMKHAVPIDNDIFFFENILRSSYV
jgi:DNA primase